jgi:hypothetical protein
MRKTGESCFVPSDLQSRMSTGPVVIHDHVGSGLLERRQLHSITVVVQTIATSIGLHTFPRPIG